MKTQGYKFKNTFGGVVRTVILPVTAALTLAFGLWQCSASTMSVALKPVSVPVGLERNGAVLNLDGGLGLTVNTGTALNVQVTSCASGYNYGGTGALATGATITSVVNLYNGDQNCLVKLRSFTLTTGGVTTTYSSLATGATQFTTWLAGDTATFASTISATDQITVFVRTQVSSTLNLTDAVLYNFTDLQGSTTASTASDAISTPVTLTVNGNVAPDFTYYDSRLLSTNSDGSVNLNLQFQCPTNVTGSAPASCDGLNEGKMDYLLVPNTYGTTALSVAQVNAIFAAGVPVAVVQDPTGATAVGTLTAMTHGGIETGSVSTIAATPIYPSNLDQLIIIRLRDAANKTLSYEYFYVNIGSITQS